MAAVIRIEVQTSGGIEAVKKDIQDLGKTAESSGGGFSAMREIATGALREIGAAAVNLAGAAFSKLTDVVGDSISAARESNLVAAQTAQVIKSTGGAAGVTTQHVLDYASALSAASGKSLFGDEQIAQSTNLLLTFTNIKGKALDAATAISVDMAQALGGAPKDAAIQLGKALNDPVKGITALTRVGVSFTDEQKAQIQAMQEAGDMAGAQQVILAELNKEFGGSAEAAAKADGGFAQFQDRLGEMEETIGKAILPVLTQLMGVVNDNLLPIIENAAAQLGPFIEGLQPMIAAAQAMIAGLLSSFSNTSPLDTFTAASTALGSFWSTQLQPALTAVWTVLQTQVWPILQDLGTALFPLVGAAIQILAGFWTDVLVPALTAFWQVLTTVVLPVIAALAAWLRDNLPPVIQGVADFLTGTLFPAFNTIYTFISTNVIPILAQIAQWLITNIPVAIQTASDFFNTVILPALNAVWAFISANVIPIIMQVVTWLQTNIPIAVQAAADFWNNILLPALNAVWSFLNTYVIPIISALINVHLALLGAAVRLLAGAWTGVLQPALQAAWAFIQNTLGPVFAWLNTNVLQPLLQTFQNIAFFVLGALKPYMEQVAQVISGAVSSAFNHLTNIAGDVRGALKAIGDAVQGVISWLNDLISKINSISVPDFLQGHSPPPMADWFTYIAESVKAVNAQLPTMQMNLAAQVGPGGQSITNTASSRSFTYAPTITTSGDVHPPMDMSLASSLAGV